MPYSDSIKVVRGIIILDDEGDAITKKYYTNDFPTAEAQSTFEQKIFKKFKTSDMKESTTVGLLDRYVVVGKRGRDCSIFLYGSENENEMILSTSIEGFYEALLILLKTKVERNEMLKKMPSLFLLMDEFCDAGVLKEIDGNLLFRNVEMRLK